MKNITLSADESLIETARGVARGRRTTLNALFREWLGELVDRQTRERQVAALLDRLDYVHSGRVFTRDEMNER